jgi:hypothetical protein
MEQQRSIEIFFVYLPSSPKILNKIVEKIIEGIQTNG